MVLVILAVVQIVLLAILVILFLTKGRSDLQNSVPELLTGLADLRSSAERLEGKSSARTSAILREDSLSYSQQARKEAAVDARSLREELVIHVGQLGGQINDNLSEIRRDQVSAANQLRDGVTTQIDRLVSSTTESDQQLRDVMQEKFAGLAAAGNRSAHAIPRSPGANKRAAEGVRPDELRSPGIRTP